MTLFGELLGAEDRAGVTGRELLDMIEAAGGGTGRSLTGITVTPAKALGNSAVNQAVQVIGGAAAALPLILFERKGEDRVRSTGHRLYSTLHDQPNPATNAAVFTRAQYLSKLLHGNRYAEIEMNGAGQPLWLWHLPPELVTPRKVYQRLGGGLTDDPAAATPEDRRRGGTIVYEVVNTQGGTVFLEPERVFHVPDHLSWNGIEGISRIRAALEPIALALAAQGTASSLFGNDATPGLVIMRPNESPPLSPQAMRSRLAAFEAQHGGYKRKGRVAYLQEGESIEKVSLSPADAQLLEIIELGILQVAQIFNLPPYFLGHPSSKEVYSNIESEWQKLVMQSLMGHLIDDQQEVRRKLLSPDERDRFYAEYETKALLRADSKGRADIHRMFLEMGIETPNQVARAENIAPVPADQGGDTYRLPRTLGAAAVVLSEPSTAATQNPPAQPAK